MGLSRFGIDRVCDVVGRRNPGIYDWDLSHYAMEIGLAVHRRGKEHRSQQERSQSTVLRMSARSAARKLLKRAAVAPSITR